MRKLRHSARRALTLLTLGALILTGCQAIPFEGDVREGLDDFALGQQQVLYNPLGPMEGANQREILLGFLSAASSSTDDYSVAREFLAPDLASEWDPNRSVLVDEG